MQEVVRSIFRIPRSFRPVSLAGTGLPERMRSTAFAFLGLTAAAGLALVAIFAQLSFPLLTPAPLPSEPTEQNRVAEAVALDRGSGASAPAWSQGNETASQDANGGGGQGGSAPGGSAPGDGGSPAPAPSPGSNGGGVSEPAGVPSPDPAPASSPASEPAPPESVPVASPKPTPARPAVPAPEPAPAPGNSESTAAAEHASERGIEASAKTSAASSPGASAAPPSEALPGNGNGNALGHGK